MNINLNSISKAAFEEHNDKPKFNMSFSERKQIIGDLVSDIRNSYVYNFTDSKENTIKFLKTILEYCYISNIDLNTYIQLKTNEEI